MKNLKSDEYHDLDSLFWFDEEEMCIRSVYIYEVLDKKINSDKHDLEDLVPKIQERQESILNMEDTCYYLHLKGGSYDLIKEDFVNDLKPEEKLGFNTPFEFRGMRINITGVESWSKVDNRFSDYDGKDVFLLSVELENVSDQKNRLNQFSYKTFDPDGKESPNIYAYFDKTLQHHEELLAGGKTKALYPILYSGDGEYQIHFDDEQIVIFNIKQN